MTAAGCANGCARPYMAELGFVGDGPNSYQVWLGGSFSATRLALPYAERVKLQASLAARPRTSWAGERARPRARRRVTVAARPSASAAAAADTVSLHAPAGSPRPLATPAP